MTLLVAITGGIGSGKSTFSKQLIIRGFKLLDSDYEVYKIYKKPNNEFLSLLKKIGLEKSIQKGMINKKYISDVIFSDKNTRLKLQKYIFKRVHHERQIFINKERKRKTKTIFFDIPLLFENKMEKKFDIIISIISSRQERYKRVKKTKKISKLLFKKILKSQTSDVVRKMKSDIIIKNNYSMADYRRKIRKTIDLFS